ncbi:MAG: glutaredoxin family protein [Solirubrobacterales bacterium]
MQDSSKTAVARIYSKDHCGSCVRARYLLQQIGARVEEIDLTGDIDGMRRIIQLTGKLTLPQIFVGDELIGGYEELENSLRNPRIREALGV